RRGERTVRSRTGRRRRLLLLDAGAQSQVVSGRLQNVQRRRSDAVASRVVRRRTCLLEVFPAAPPTPDWDEALVFVAHARIHHRRLGEEKDGTKGRRDTVKRGSESAEREKETWEPASERDEARGRSPETTAGARSGKQTGDKNGTRNTRKRRAAKHRGPEKNRSDSPFELLDSFRVKPAQRLTALGSQRI
ncbi:hypothetical protein TGFOU_406100, partial [Toxoplasma gondii FOU]